MVRRHAHPDAADLLHTEHAVVRVLASAHGEQDAYPGLLAAIGESLGCAGAVWLPSPEDGELRCAETWPAGAAAGASLVAQARAAPVAVPGAFAFPLADVGVMAFATTAFSAGSRWASAASTAAKAPGVSSAWKARRRAVARVPSDVAPLARRRPPGGPGALETEPRAD